MAALTNTRHERFAQELAKGKSQIEAYENAGYRPSRSAAARLAADVNICERVAEIQERAATRTELTIASATKHLLELAEMGKLLADASGIQASRASMMDACKLNGLVVDKSEVKQEIEVTDARERLARIVAGHASTGGGSERAAKPH